MRESRPCWISTSAPRVTSDSQLLSCGLKHLWGRGRREPLSLLYKDCHKRFLHEVLARHFQGNTVLKNVIQLKTVLLHPPRAHLVPTARVARRCENRRNLFYLFLAWSQNQTDWLPVAFGAWVWWWGGDGMGWDMMGWDGMGWDGTWWEGKGHDGKGRDVMG